MAALACNSKFEGEGNGMASKYGACLLFRWLPASTMRMALDVLFSSGALEIPHQDLLLQLLLPALLMRIQPAWTLCMSLYASLHRMSQNLM